MQGETSNTTTIGGSKNYKKDADEFWYRTWQMNFGTGLGSWIHCGFLGNQWLFNVKSFLETCIFHVVDQPKGLGVRDSDSVYGKNAEDVSQLGVRQFHRRFAQKKIFTWLVMCF